MDGRIGDLVEQGGYVAIGAVMVVECIFPPIPSEAGLLLAGVGVGDGRLTFQGALLAATIGSLIGAVLLYLVGWYGGRPLVLRYGRMLRVTPKDLDRAESWFDRYGPVVVLTTRMIPLIRSIVSIPAGLTRMQFALFCILTAIGSLMWNAVVIGLGWGVGENWEEVGAVLGLAGTVVGVLVAAGGALTLIWWFRRRSAARVAELIAETPPES